MDISLIKQMFPFVNIYPTSHPSKWTRIPPHIHKHASNVVFHNAALLVCIPPGKALKTPCTPSHSPCTCAAAFLEGWTTKSSFSLPLPSWFPTSSCWIQIPTSPPSCICISKQGQAAIPAIIHPIYPCRDFLFQCTPGKLLNITRPRSIQQTAESNAVRELCRESGKGEKTLKKAAEVLYHQASNNTVIVRKVNRNRDSLGWHLGFYKNNYTSEKNNIYK